MELAPTVLLVAPAPAALESVRLELAVAGLRALAAATPEEALRMATAHRYDAAIVSAALPDGGAPALIQRLKQLQPAVACIVVADQPSREDALQSLAAGALAYVIGPPRAEALVGLVKERRRHTLSATEDALTVQVHEQDGAPLLALSGDLDLVTAPLLQRRIDELLGAGHDRLLFDADSLGFCDSTGLRVLLGARRRVAERAGELRLLRTSPVLQRLLDLSGLDGGLQPAAPH